MSESEAEEVRGGLDSILGIAKMAGGAEAAAVKQQDEAAGAALEAILKSLEAKTEGTEISVVIPKPAGFEEAVKSAVSTFGGGLGADLLTLKTLIPRVIQRRKQNGFDGGSRLRHLIV